MARDDQALDARVVALIQAFSEARSRFDAKALDALLSPDYVEISPIGEIDRREAVLGFYAGDKARPSPPMTLSTQDVRRYTDTAIVIGSVTYVVPAPNGATVERTLRATYVERWGRWALADGLGSIHWRTTPTAGAAARSHDAVIATDVALVNTRLPAALTRCCGSVRLAKAIR